MSGGEPSSAGCRLSLQWPVAKPVAEEDLWIELVNDSDEIWYPEPHHDFRVTGMIQRTDGTDAGFWFAFVGGSTPARSLRPGERVELKVHILHETSTAPDHEQRAISAVLSSLDLRSSTTATVFRTSPDPPISHSRASSSAFHCEFDTRRGSGREEIEWFLHDPNTGENQQGSADERVLPEALQLAFPKRMPIWGRDSDEYRPILIQLIGRHSIIITFENQRDLSVRGTAVFNTRLGVFERFTDPLRVNILRYGSHARTIERRERSELGEVGYLDPDF